MTVAQVDQREWVARPVAAVVGSAIVPIVFVVLGWLRPFGLDFAAGLERPDLLLMAVVVGAIVGFGAGRYAVSGRPASMLLVGAFAGLSWLILLIAGVVLAEFVTEILLGETGVSAAAAPLAWVIYGFAVSVAFAALPLTAIGTAWAIVTRALATIVSRRLSGPWRSPRRARTAALGAFLATITVMGTVQAALIRPGGATCIPLPGEQPVAGAWSPDGSLLAIASTTDPDEQGHVRVLRWPSMKLVAQWTSWVDQTVAVDDSGRAYWSAWVMGPWPMDADAGSSGIYTAAPGLDPSWFTSDAGHAGAEATLWSMSWTRDGLVGMTPNSHVVAIAPFGPTQPVGLVRQGKRSVGVVWASPERDWLLTAGEWFATTLRIEHDGEVDDLPVSGDPRSVAMTPDRRGVVVASWFGGTRLVDLASGKSEVVLAREQAWIAVSRTGQLAWANDVAYGPGITCVVHLRPST